MEKRTENSSDMKSSLNLENRNKLIVSGVVEVINFDEIKINLTTKLGNLIIKGENLKMNKLDVQNGEVIICGEISSMIYGGKVSKKNNEKLIQKLFR